MSGGKWLPKLPVLVGVTQVRAARMGQRHDAAADTEGQGGEQVLEAVVIDKKFGDPESEAREKNQQDVEFDEAFDCPVEKRHRFLTGDLAG